MTDSPNFPMLKERSGSRLLKLKLGRNNSKSNTSMIEMDKDLSNGDGPGSPEIPFELEKPKKAVSRPKFKHRSGMKDNFNSRTKALKVIFYKL